MAKKPFFREFIYIGDCGDDYDEILGYDVPEDIADLEEGRHVAMYRLVTIKRVRKSARLDAK